MVREVKGIEKVSILGAGRGARERRGRRLEVEVNSKCRSPSHYVSNLVLETVEESWIPVAVSGRMGPPPPMVVSPGTAHDHPAISWQVKPADDRCPSRKRYL